MSGKCLTYELVWILLIIYSRDFTNRLNDGILNGWYFSHSFAFGEGFAPVVRNTDANCSVWQIRSPSCSNKVSVAA